MEENENNRIFFHETTGRNILNLRQLCAVESAAKENPDRPVQLFMQSNDVDEASPVIPVLSNYPNVAVILLNATEYFSGTVSVMPLCKTSVILTIITVVAFGGMVPEHRMAKWTISYRTLFGLHTHFVTL